MRRIRALLNRIRGFSTPFGGLSWQAVEPGEAIARRVLLFLADRRVLYAKWQDEEVVHAVPKSVQEIRRFLSTLLDSRPQDDKLADVLVELQEHCRNFL